MKKAFKMIDKEDKIYQEYKKNNKEPSDFERFCFAHCRDIENVLNELDKLREQIRILTEHPIISKWHKKLYVEDLKNE